MSGLGTSGEDRPVTWGLLFIQLPQMFPLLPMGGGGGRFRLKPSGL